MAVGWVAFFENLGNFFRVLRAYFFNFEFGGRGFPGYFGATCAHFMHLKKQGQK
jgi:hypothetical protein